MIIQTRSGISILTYITTLITIKLTNRHTDATACKTKHYSLKVLILSELLLLGCYSVTGVHVSVYALKSNNEPST